MTSRIQSIEVSFFVHSTENQDRVRSAVERELGIDAVPKIDELSGHFGNRIVHFSYRLTGEAASSNFTYLAHKLPSSLRNEIVEKLGEMVDEHSVLYLRLDKQALVTGKLAMGGGESVRLRVKPMLFMMKEGGAEFFRSVLRERQ